jgi:hypothetical protein
MTQIQVTLVEEFLKVGFLTLRVVAPEFQTDLALLEQLARLSPYGLLMLAMILLARGDIVFRATLDRDAIAAAKLYTDMVTAQTTRYTDMMTAQNTRFEDMRRSYESRLADKNAEIESKNQEIEAWKRFSMEGTLLAGQATRLAQQKSAT